MEKPDQIAIVADPAVYASFPEIIRTGEMMIVPLYYQDLAALRAHPLHPHYQPVAKIRYAVSRDSGQTWALTDDPPPLGIVRHATRYTVTMPGGGVFRIQRRYMDGTMTAEPLQVRHFPHKLTQAESATPITDYGPAGWTPPDMVPVIWSIDRLADGAFIAAAYARLIDPVPRGCIEGEPFERGWPQGGQRWTTFFYRGSPDGRQWSYLSTIPNRHAFCLGEPNIAVMGDGRIVCVIRTDWPPGYKDLMPDEVNGNGRKRDGYGWWLYQCESTDGGRTWTEPVRLPIWGHPPYMLPLASGNLLMVFGHRRPPFGVRAVLSRDGGRTWDLSTLKVLRNFEPGSYDLGYPIATQLDDGRIFCCYYGHSTADVGEKAPHGVFATVFDEDWLGR